MQLTLDPDFRIYIIRRPSRGAQANDDTEEGRN